MAEQMQIETEDPDVARDEIEKIRARMSSTLDQIEEVIVSKKEQIRADLDIGARIREKPLKTAGIVFGTALVLGFLTGGGRKEARLRKEYGARALHWENRARRLLAIAREQEEEIDELSNGSASPHPRSGPDLLADDDRDDDIDDYEEDYDDAYDDDDDEDEVDDVEDDEFEADVSDEDDVSFAEGKWEAARSRFSGLKQVVTEKVAEFVEETTRNLIDGIRERR